MSLLKRLFGGSDSKSAAPDIDFLLARSTEDLRAKSAAHSVWGFGTEMDWAFDQDTAEITFTFENGTAAQAPAQIIGTVNTADSTWLWSWANASIDSPLTRDARALRSHGEKYGVRFLTDRKFSVTQERAWQLTALSVYLNGAQGAYRGPAGTALVFITFGKVRLSRRPGGA